MIVKKILLVFLAVTTASLIQAGEEIVAPVGWRVPTKYDFPDPERMALATTRVSKDFNGDGIPDKIVTLICKRNKNVFGLFAYYGGKSEPEKINKKPIQQREYHLYPIKPGQYYLQNYPQALVLKFGGFMRQEIEYSYGTVYWFTEKGWKHTSSTGEPLRKILKESNKT